MTRIIPITPEQDAGVKRHLKLYLEASTNVAAALGRCSTDVAALQKAIEEHQRAGDALHQIRVICGDAPLPQETVIKARGGFDIK